MNRADVADTFKYGRKLVNAGVDGIRTGQPGALDGRPLSCVVSETAAGAATLAAAGACVALLGSYLMRRRGRAANPFAYAAVGMAVGLFAGASWKSRKVASSLAHSALKQMHKASDEHWLERHPIDYA